MARDWDDDDAADVPRWLVWVAVAVSILGFIETIRFGVSLISSWIG